MSHFQKGMILAGGTGSRLHPMTKGVSKQLLPIFDKPMIYYPLSTLMLAGIRDILVITTPRDQSQFRALLEDGSQLGIKLTYAVQDSPDGLPQAFQIGESFIDGQHVALVLGDNLFYGHGLVETLSKATRKSVGATIFTYPVQDPQRYGVIEFDEKGQPETIIEKPAESRSHQAVTGLYFFDQEIVDISRNLQPSARGELEITDALSLYLERGNLQVENLGRGFAWLDTGTESSLLKAANFVESVQSRQGLRIACIEEVAYRMGFITALELEQLAITMNNPYGRYLLEIIKH